MSTDRNIEGSIEEPSLPGGSESSAFESLLRQVARIPGAPDLSPTVELAPGAVVADRFELVREIGRGGFARVFEARDRILSRPVAIKLLKRRQSLNDSELALFYREARATARLNHPHIVTAHDWGAWNGMPFLVLELLDGESLEKLLSRGPLDEQRAWEVVAQTTEALAYAHAHGVLHLDLKTQNVFVLRDGWVKVLDFGLAGLDLAEDIPGRPVRAAGGTPGTMAPEQVEGAPTDARTDLWAVGIILHQLLFGRLPEKLAPGAECVALPSGASPRAHRVLSRTLCRAPSDRYPDAVALLADAVVRPTGTRRVRMLVGLGLVLTGIAVVAGLWRIGAFGARHDQTWLRAEVIPELHRLVNANQLAEAQRLAMRAEAAVPGNAELRAAWGSFTRPLSITTSPSGAKVFWREYDRQDAAWEYLGTTPLQLFFPWGAHRMRFELDGYRPYEAAPSWTSDPFPLDRLGSIPDSLVHVPGGHFGPGPEDEEIELPGYLIDRFEVTNRRYQAFVDAGAYRRPEFWRQAFVENGRRVSFREAMSRFTDRTGHPGPSTWHMGTHLPGQEDYPVSGVSLYEAAAYAAFEGRESHDLSLEAGRLGRVGLGPRLAQSNFTNGARAGGTVSGHERIRRSGHGRKRPRTVPQRTRGSPIHTVHPRGGWDDPTYAYTVRGSQPPWDRSPTNGFRLVTYPEPSANLDARPRLRSGPGAGNRDYLTEMPVADPEFRIYQRMYAYDRKPLNAKLVERSAEAVDLGPGEGPRSTRHTVENGCSPISSSRRAGRRPIRRSSSGPAGASSPAPSPKVTPGRSKPSSGSWCGAAGLVVVPIFRGTFERPSDSERAPRLLGHLPRCGDPVDPGPETDRRLPRDTKRHRPAEARLCTDNSWGGLSGLSSWRWSLGSRSPRSSSRGSAPRDLFPRPSFQLPSPSDIPYPCTQRAVRLLLTLSRNRRCPVPATGNTSGSRSRQLVYESGHLLPSDQLKKETLAWYDRFLGTPGQEASPAR